MEVIEIRVGETRPPSFYTETVTPDWPEAEHSSAYVKNVVPSVQVTKEDGLQGNGIGFPTHIEYAAYRSALVSNELVWADIEREIPGSIERMKRGCFGENFVVNHPDLHPGVVCVGDEYRIGTAVFRVTGPRMPCPKVDGFLGIKGVTALGRKTSWTGYFFQVVESGVCTTGDSIVLLSRPYPTMNLMRLAKGLWGDSNEQDHSKEFLTLVSSIECLMPRHYRDTAALRLQRLQDA